MQHDILIASWDILFNPHKYGNSAQDLWSRRTTGLW